VNERESKNFGRRRPAAAAMAERPASLCTALRRFVVTLGAGFALGGGVPAPAASLPAPSAAPVMPASVPLASLPPDSIAHLPFLAAPKSGQRFSISSLTRHYEHDLNMLTSPAAAATERDATHDLEWLDRYAANGAPADTTNAHRLDQLGRTEASMTPGERKAAEPPKPPVHVGIPSPVAIVGSFAGGLFLLAKLIAGLAR
jgi:hypothetical protein